MIRLWPDYTLLVSREACVVTRPGVIVDDPDAPDPETVINLFQEDRVAVMAKTLVMDDSSPGGHRTAAAIAVSARGTAGLMSDDGWKDAMRDSLRAELAKLLGGQA